MDLESDKVSIGLEKCVNIATVPAVPHCCPFPEEELLHSVRVAAENQAASSLFSVMPVDMAREESQMGLLGSSALALRDDDTVAELGGEKALC